MAVDLAFSPLHLTFWASEFVCLFLLLILQIKLLQYKRESLEAHFRFLHLHTCYYSSMIFPTCNVTYFIPPQVFHRLRYWSFKNKSTMSQLPMLAKSKSIYICLWKYTAKVNNKYADIYIITCFLLPKWKSNYITIKKAMFY